MDRRSLLSGIDGLARRVDARLVVMRGTWGGKGGGIGIGVGRIGEGRIGGVGVTTLRGGVEIAPWLGGGGGDGSKRGFPFYIPMTNDDAPFFSAWRAWRRYRGKDRGWCACVRVGAFRHGGPRDDIIRGRRRARINAAIIILPYHRLSGEE